MNPVKLFKEAYAAVKDPNRDFDERMYLILAFVSEITVFAALLGDLYIKENPQEIIVIVATLIFVPLITFICLRFDKLKIAIRLTALGLVFLIMPGLFFFGGGLKGGGITWIIFAFLYVGLILRGVWRNLLFVLIILFTLISYIINYYYPWYVYRHSTSKHYIDSFISLVLVGVLCFFMNWSQRWLFTEENKRAKKEAERAEELTKSQNRFFSSMSHEIRTPINSILGLNELILRDQTASDEIIKDATGIQGSGKMLLALINDILDFSKLEAGSMDIVPVDYRIGDMLSEIVNIMWLRAYDKGLIFDISVDPDVPMVLYGDEIRIKQIIINILNNAVKYTDRGRVELRVESRDKGSGEVELLISVTDTGMGIKKEDIPYLFNAFKRVDEGKNRHIEGTGLGLSIVKQLIEKMGGTITVNSVYGEGSIFTITLRQHVSDATKVGELNIHNQQVVRRSTYESSFIAPEAKILIVDDNEMNLEVESRLLEDTDINIHKAKSAKEALDKSLKYHYDTIFMDHLMPEIDGVECLELLRNQQGGLNRNTPVVVLTANAGSENRDLYNKAGFDGYLVKPVSGISMEEILIQHISKDKLILKNKMMGAGDDIIASDKYSEKLPVIITSSSMSDIPEQLIRKLHIPIIPFRITTDEGVFKDGVQIDANELIRHVNLGKDAYSSPQDETSYMEFFAEILKRAHHLIHISITSGMSDEYKIASEAAKTFDNVTVVNSGVLSSATGILVLIAYKLAQQGLPVKDILTELETVKTRLKCSFIIDTTRYMVRRGLVSKRFGVIAEALNLHPALRVRDNKAGVGGAWVGTTRRAYKKYIRKALPADTIPDPEVVFVTYADISHETLTWIEEEIRKNAYFEHVIFKQASAAISSNCGPGTFGILYFLKSNKSYNISNFIDNITDAEEEPGYENENVEEFTEETEENIVNEREEQVEGSEEDTTQESVSEEAVETGTKEWYQGIKDIDTDAAIKNSGSADAFRAVLEIFHDSIADKKQELENCYAAEDWDNYTIKIHALKSSSRLVGALELGDQAERLENAGKENDIQYIRDNHEAAMERFASYKEILDPVFGGGSMEADGDESSKPVADKYLMQSIYEGLKEAADAMDCDTVEAILKEIEGYSIPPEEAEKFGRVREKAEALDYSGMMDELC